MQQANGIWEMPWYKGIPIAQNMFTGKQYGGNNLLILWQQCLKKNYQHNQWATLYQWRKVKAKVKRGEKGTLICVAIPKRKQKRDRQAVQLSLYEPLKPTDINPKNTYFTFRFTYLFNEAQVNCYFGNQPGLFDAPLSGQAQMKQLIDKSEAQIKIGGERAFYTIFKDEIHIPDRRASCRERV